MLAHESISLTITHNAALGDGVGRHEGLPVYVPYTVEGDVAQVEITHHGGGLARARLLEVTTASPHRRDPACPYFGRCGGCSLQHLSPDYYRRIKEEMAQRVLKELQQPAHLLQPLYEVGAASRRRVEWAVRVHKSEVSVGYQIAKSHEVVAIAECPVAVPTLSGLLAPLKAAMQRMKKPTVIRAIALTALPNGIDATLHLRAPLHHADVTLWRDFTLQHGILRLATHEEGKEYHTFVQHTPPHILFGEVAVSLPVGAFLQASEAAERMMANMVQQHLQGCLHIVDMYAGCGTYSFPMHAQSTSITAYEGAPDMVAAMHNAISAHGLSDKMMVACRDLWTNPLTHTALQQVDGVVINPPRNGALPQIKELAASSVARIAMISCNPATFIRDAAYLIQGGYQLISLTPIDQFTWSAHLEVVGLFVRG